jgi:hypothetical protein
VGISLAAWQQHLLHQLTERGITALAVTSGPFVLLEFEHSESLVIHLVPVYNPFTPKDLLDLQAGYRAQDIQLVHLWEDIYLDRGAQVLGRIRAMLGLNRKIHGRKTRVESITQTVADEFFALNHLQGGAKARYKYALMYEGQIVAVASFSAKRAMTRRAPGYTSVELILFATAEGYTVQGGLSKLIQHLVKTVQPNDVMTYADLDWSYGKGYAKLGFQLEAQSAPAEVFLDKQSGGRYFRHRLPAALAEGLAVVPEAELESYLKSSAYNRIFNTGNLKYILYL